MFFRFVILSTIFSLMMVASQAVADSVTIDLEYRTDTLAWELYAQINDTGSGNSGDNGLAAVRALIDNIDFGTNGDAVNLSMGIGAIDPIDAGGPNQRPAVVQTSGGTLDIIYGQDISTPGSVVGGVGNSRTLIMDGTFPSAGTPPAFGDDDNGFTTDGNFLDVAAPGPFGLALAWDSAILNVLDVTPLGVAGDYNADGTVDAADYTVWRDNLGTTNSLPNDAIGGTIGTAQYNQWTNNFGSTSPASAVAVPEPSSLFLALVVPGLVACRRNRS